MATGYIYILSNPSMVGLLKVGYSCVSVEKRARELSVSTGVPSPFVIEYFQLSDDVEEVEAQVHAGLERFRVSENREFFLVPVNVAVDVIEKSVRKPVVMFRNTAGAEIVRPEPRCRRCGHPYERTINKPLCPKCGF